MTAPILEARDVTVVRDGAAVLDGLSLTVEPTSRTLIQGRSGAGKTTLFRVLGLLEPPHAGSVRVDGTDASTVGERGRAALRRDRLGFVFQDFQLIPDLTAWENARLPQEHDGATGGDAAWLGTVFEALEIDGLRDRYPSTLSGGERQRVAIARALANRPAVVLGDEPTGELDPETTERVLELLFRVQSVAEAALVIVSHDPRLTEEFPARYELSQGELEFTGTAAVDEVAPWTTD